MGGCQGCHGAAGQSNGGDMSILIGFGPSNAAGPPESIDNAPETAAKSYAVRSYGLNRARSLGLIPPYPRPIGACRLSRPSTVRKTEVNRFRECRQRSPTGSPGIISTTI